MEKITSTGRETYNSQIGECVAVYTKITTGTNVYINVDVKKDEEVVFTASYDRNGNRFSSNFRQFDAVGGDVRTAIVTQVMKDINSIV